MLPGDRKNWLRLATVKPHRCSSSLATLTTTRLTGLLRSPSRCQRPLCCFRFHTILAHVEVRFLRSLSIFAFHSILATRSGFDPVVCCRYCTCANLANTHTDTHFTQHHPAVGSRWAQDCPLRVSGEQKALFIKPRTTVCLEQREKHSMA